jgi:hypothetical protein
MNPRPGDLAVIKLAPDQTLYVRKLAGKTCVVLKNLTAEDGVFSSRNMWDVLVEGQVVRVHRLDLMRLEDDERY